MKKYNIRQSIFVLIITINVWSLAQAAENGMNQAERMAKVNQLLEAANARSPSRPIPDEIRNETDRAIINQYNEERRRLVREDENKREQARNELAAMGDEIIDQLAEIYKDGRYEYHIALVLKKIGTQKAKEILLNMSLGQNGFNETDSTAARQYVEIARDKEEIKPLLVSNNSDVLSNALRGIAGIKVDAELLNRLDEILQSVKYHPGTNRILRMYASSVIDADPSNELIEEKVAVLFKSIQTVEQIPKVNERYGQTDIGTFADRMYSHLSLTLRRMKDIDDYLSEATNTLTGNPRRWIIITRAKLGDSTVKNEIKEILEDPNMLESTILRSAAIEGFKEIGTAEDIPFLRNIAETDPVLLLRPFIIDGPILEMIDDKPINNTGDGAAIYDEYSILVQWNDATREYFIRNQAESAIKAIEDRIKTNPSRATVPNN